MSLLNSPKLSVPFFRPEIGEDEIQEVVECLRSGWLTTGPRTQEFETRFAAAVGAEHAIALNSGTAALHLSVESNHLRPGQAVLVPTLTFAATAEVVRYQGAVPILVDCDKQTLNMDLSDAACKLRQLRQGELFPEAQLQPVGIIPVHVGGLMMDLDAVTAFAREHDLWVVEDAAHAFPAAYRNDASSAWTACGAGTASTTCFSFYANKTMTTGEGGMVVTNDPEKAQRIKQMSLHGLSKDAWGRYSGRGSWDYQIIDIGFKYNFTDIAAAIGLHQLERAESMRLQRESIAHAYLEAFEETAEIELPANPAHRIHAWHLFPIRLNLDCLTLDRDAFLEQLRAHGVGFSVHWRPLHLHPYWRDHFQWSAAQLPQATCQWQRLVSLPIFQGMRTEEIDHVIHTVKTLCAQYRR